MIIREWTRVSVEQPPKYKRFLAYFDHFDEMEIIVYDDDTDVWRNQDGLSLDYQETPLFSHWCLIDKPHD